MNLDITRHAIKELTGHLETNSTIWKNIRHSDIRRPIQLFLYKALAGSLQIGNFWEKIPTYEHRAKCHKCTESIENLEHIMLECSTPERELTWNLTNQLWPTPEQRPTTIGHILSVSCISLTPSNDENPTTKECGQARLKRILISESAHLIWVLRCERVIQNTRHTPQAITSRWINKITNRLNIDRHLAKAKQNTAFTNKIVNTWTEIIQQTQRHDWATNTEVLVGINLFRPPSRPG